LPDGQEIAVKRLDKASAQGLKELRNELLLMAKLRHNNLAKLLGVCLKGQEKLLVYEYLPNRSLDTFLFGTSCSPFSFNQKDNKQTLKKQTAIHRNL
jgi:serine/threonine protein kinase